MLFAMVCLGIWTDSCVIAFDLANIKNIEIEDCIVETSEDALLEAVLIDEEVDADGNLESIKLQEDGDEQNREQAIIDKEMSDIREADNEVSEEGDTIAALVGPRSLLLQVSIYMYIYSQSNLIHPYIHSYVHTCTCYIYIYIYIYISIHTHPSYSYLCTLIYTR